MIPRMILLLICLIVCISLMSCTGTKGNVYPLERDYISHTDLYSRLSELAQLQPALLQLRIIGFSSVENLPIYALELGKKQAAQEILIIGQHHGDEVLGVNLSLAWAEKLLTGYGNDREVDEILSRYRFWIVPTINPDAFRIVSQGLFEFKRKNNRDTDGNQRLDLRTDGVDLNRNYPVFWDLDPDTNINSPYFKGTEPASESEVKAVISLAQQHQFALAIFYHSSASGAYSEKIYLPARGNGSPLFSQTLDLAHNYAKRVKKDYHPGTYEVHEGITSEVGNARNYFFHSRGTKAFLVEIGGINQRGQSVIHPEAGMLQKIVKRHLGALTTLFTSSDI